MESIITIKLEKVNSNKFEKAINMMKNFPHFEVEEKNEKIIFICRIENIYEYINTYPTIEPLVQMVRNWGKSTIYLHDKVLSKQLIYFREFQKKMDQKAINAVNYEFRPFIPGSVASDIISLDEDLTYPIIYYPPIYSPFFSFAKSIDDKPFFCSCQKDSIYNYLEMEKEMFNSYTNTFRGPFSVKFFPKIIKKHYSNSNNEPSTAFEFKDNICHRCLEKVPKYNFCESMYGSKFKQKYGWYINEKYFEYGIFQYGLDNLKYLKKECPDHIYSLLQLDLNDIKIKNSIERELENIVREEFKVALIGEKWISETIMFKILENLFSDEEIYKHHRPKWLEGLELDAYIPEKKLAFEYNGKQHYESVEFFGGKDQLVIQKKNDRKKLEICRQKGIDLIIVKYDEELNVDLINKKVNLVKSQV